MRQLYMSSYHLSPDLIPYYLDALVKYRVKYLFGYTSSLMALAHEARRLGWREIPFQLSLTNAEPLLDHQRDVLQEAFGCPARETYGMAEIVTAASECSAGQLHLWPEVGIVELLEGDQAVSLGTPGDLVCTGLFNQDMPLIRYRLGDRGCRAIREAECGCGRLLPSLSYIEGRCDDLLYTPEGRRVGRLDTVFKGDAPIREAQIIQQELDEILVRIVKAPGYSSHTERGLVERLQERMGPVHVRMEYVEELRRGAGGKFQAVVCKLSDEQRRLAANVAAKEPV
ncbi:MAG: phenylacetate--CoA ligase family protein [Planctomycetia bacterium]|nr:phenylacetate--CoA ligase family protein [Planctomycetia bacterium]